MSKRKPRRRRRGANRGPFFLLLVAAVAIGALLYRSSHAPDRHVTSVDRTLPAQAQAPAATQMPTMPPTPPGASAARTATPSSTPKATAPAAASQVGEHRLAIIIDDCGQWPKTERALIALPIPITMSVMPKERYTQTIAREAAAAGKGVMLHLPMEPVAAIDPGPGKITTTMSDAAIVAQVQEDVASVPLAAGVNNHEGSKASSDPRVMKDVVSVLGPAGLFFIDSRTSADSVAAEVAAQSGLRTASRDIFLDNQDDVEAVKAMLRQAAAIALKTGDAIAIGHPRTATLEAIQSLIPELQGQGITFVEAASLVH